MAIRPTPPPGWQPVANGGYRNPASGTIIYPDGRGGWTASPTSGVGLGALGTQNARVNAPVNTRLSATHGLGPHAALKNNAARVAALPGGMTPMQVRAMQQFLVNHGFEIPIDGIYGPLTKAAAASFRANHKSGPAFSKAHGLGVHPGSKPIKGTPGPAGTDAVDRTTAGGKNPAGRGAPDSGDAFTALLDSLLAGGGNVGRMLDTKSFGDAAAAPALAEAAALQREIAANPKQEAQNQFDISSWYGLDPNAKGYQLSVLGRLGLARDRDVEAANAAADSAKGIAQALAGSIGGSANGASGSVLSAGENAAGTAAALGEISKQYAADVAPLLEAEARGAQAREKAQNSQELLDLRDRLSQAQGQAKSDRAAAVLQALDKNNALAQQRFANQGNLLSMLAQFQAVNPESDALKNKKLLAEIAKINAQTNAIKHPTTKATSPAKVNLGDIVGQVAGSLGVGSDHRLPEGLSIGGVAHLVGSALQAAGISKKDPRYQRLGQSIMATFLDHNGNPLQIPAGWFGPNTV